jgi:hypothetical protein
MAKLINQIRSKEVVVGYFFSSKSLFVAIREDLEGPFELLLDVLIGSTTTSDCFFFAVVIV